MRDLCANKRLKIFGKDVKHIHVPQYEGLTVKDILKFGRQYVDVNKCFPSVEKEIFKLPRQYICNVIYTLVGKPFDEWVTVQKNIRHKKVQDERNMNIEMDPQIAEIFRNSQAVSGKF